MSAPSIEYDELLARARVLARGPGRRILGIAGAPGSGKSTLAGCLACDLCSAARTFAGAVVVPLDGFHLPNAVLAKRGLADVKGAAATFDDVGYAELIEQLADPRPGETVWAPSFDRRLDEPTPGGIAVPPDVPLVITEGNYLLLDSGAWPRARARFAETWFVELDPDTRHERLIRRHIEFGKTPAAARAWALGTDEVNARLIAGSAHRADLRFQLAR